MRSVASLFVSRWDVAVAHDAPVELRNTLGIAVASKSIRPIATCWRAIASSVWQCRRAAQRCCASTGTKDKSASHTLYISGLAAPNTVNTMPEETLLAFADHGTTGSVLRATRQRAVALLAHAKAGIDVTTLAAQLQSDGAKGFVASWRELLRAIDAKSKVLT